MPGQATVIIGDSGWTATVATTQTELQAGLSGVESIPANTGVLFDMGAEYGTIWIDMTDMLFSVDIIFMDENGVVVEIMRNLAPPDDTAFAPGGGVGARFFIEVNAGEAVNVSVGDTAVIHITGVDDPSDPDAPPSTDLDINAIIQPLITIMMIGMIIPSSWSFF